MALLRVYPRALPAFALLIPRFARTVLWYSCCPHRDAILSCQYLVVALNTCNAVLAQTPVSSLTWEHAHVMCLSHVSLGIRKQPTLR